MNEREIAERVAAECVRVEEAEHQNGRFYAMVTAPGGQAVYSMTFGWKGGAEDHARRVREVLSTIIAGALAEDRLQRCANLMADNAGLRMLLGRARSVVRDNRELIVDSESVKGDLGTMASLPREWVRELDELLRAISDAIGPEKPHSQAAQSSGVAMAHEHRAPGASTGA